LPPQLLVLTAFRLRCCCPADAQRSWVALLEKGLNFEIRKVDLDNKDAEFVAIYRSINPDPEAPAKVWSVVLPGCPAAALGCGNRHALHHLVEPSSQTLSTERMRCHGVSS
jgi:hypothetical protein